MEAFVAGLCARADAVGQVDGHYREWGVSGVALDARLTLTLAFGAEAGAFAFSVEARRCVSANDNAVEHGIGLRATVEW